VLATCLGALARLTVIMTEETELDRTGQLTQQRCAPDDINGSMIWRRFIWEFRKNSRAYIAITIPGTGYSENERFDPGMLCSN